jgi:integrase
MVVFRRKDGRWVARVTRGGKRKDFYGRTRRAAVEKAQAFLRALGTGPLPQPGRRTFQDLFEAFLLATDLRPRTRADYEEVARRHLGPLMGRRLAALEPLDLLEVLQPLRDRPRTCLKVYRVIHRVLGFAARCGYLADNPADRVEVPRYRPGRPEVWSADQVRAFCAALDGHPLRALFLLLLGGGLRWSEAAALRWCDLDPLTGCVHVRRSLHRVRGDWVETAPKTKAGLRTVTLPQEAAQALRQHRLRALETALREGRPWSEEGLVFCTEDGAPLHHRRVLEAFRKVCRRAGVPVVGLHALRHQHASLLIAQGVPLPDVAQRLGHTTPAVTASIYAHALAEDRRAAEVLENLLTKGRR